MYLFGTEKLQDQAEQNFFFYREETKKLSLLSHVILFLWFVYPLFWFAGMELFISFVTRGLFILFWLDFSL